MSDLWLRERAGTKHLDPADYRGQGSAQFMGKSREKLILRPGCFFQFRGALGDSLFQVARRLYQGLLGSTAFRHIAGNFSEAYQVAVLVVNCRNDDIGPKSTSILSISPALILHSAFFSSDRQFP